MSSKRVNGKYVITGLVAFTGLFGLAFWWSQNHAYYEETQADAVEIAHPDPWKLTSSILSPWVRT